jgi:hypothetical protein
MSSAEVVTGTFELHVFVEPLNPSPEQAEAFSVACRGAPTPMKPLLLNLDYVHQGFVGVLQSSRYVDGDLEAAKRAASGDADVLRRAGFTVIREKIEALATNAGIPHTAQDALRSPADRYFEFHVLIEGREQPLTEADMVALRGLSQSHCAALKAPVPLSYNALKPSQRFLNLRSRGVGLDDALKPVHELERRIAALGPLVVKKVISEYICFDTNRAIDNGWVEPLPESP